MSDSQRTALPPWARNLVGKTDLDCNIGIQPDVVPRLPTRIIPFGNTNTLTASTVSEVIDCTQRIVTYSAHEVVHGPMADFSDLRTVDSEITDFAKLRIEPFEEGSFVIPAVLGERTTKLTVNGQEQEFSSHQIVEKFISVFEEAPDQSNRASSIGLLQAIEDLGTVLRREVERIEYYPVGMRGSQGKPHQVTVNRDYVARVATHRKQRQDPRTIPDSVEGVLTALDITQGTLKIKVQPNLIVRGSFSPFMTEHLIQSLECRVRIRGVVEYRGTVPLFIRGFFSEPAGE